MAHSKSSNRTVTDPDVVKYALLQHHYSALRAICRRGAASTCVSAAKERRKATAVPPEVIVAAAKIRPETVFRLNSLRPGFVTYSPISSSSRSSPPPPPGKLMAMRLSAAAGTLRHERNSPPWTLPPTAAVRWRGTDNVTHTVIRLFRDSMLQQREQLVKNGNDIHQLFNQVVDTDDEDKAKRAFLARHANSEYPIKIFSLAEDSEASNVSSLIAASAELSLDAAGEKVTTSEDWARVQ
ncbi:hypothetical protein Micbo1qcDRAFT_178308 [Microdochium bolleyi]|uniref:Uncharacterized protein n=1 Tax=Microdochium bolleyi TaxID=196109 RepID=A0A136ITC6_9PEZI|nr:hypothetical protein Micbo1qcDRAFT_178308 [Microdochium bolleyi]